MLSLKSLALALFPALLLSGADAPVTVPRETPAKAAHLAAAPTIDPATHGGERAEVPVTGISDGNRLDGGGEPGGLTGGFIYHYVRLEIFDAK